MLMFMRYGLRPILINIRKHHIPKCVFSGKSENLAFHVYYVSLKFQQGSDIMMNYYIHLHIKLTRIVIRETRAVMLSVGLSLLHHRLARLTFLLLFRGVVDQRVRLQGQCGVGKMKVRISETFHVE